MHTMAAVRACEGETRTRWADAHCRTRRKLPHLHHAFGIGKAGLPIDVLTRGKEGVRSGVHVHVGALQELKQVSFPRVGAQ